MVSNISHQLKTPLAALSMYMEIIMEEPENEEVVKDFTRKSIQSLERMKQLIRSLLTMARLDTGAIVFEKWQCLVSEIVEQAVNDLMERARYEGKEIRMEGQPKECLLCDPEWTIEAVGNLVKNGLDHTKAGGVIRIGGGDSLWRSFVSVWRMTGAELPRRISITFLNSFTEAVPQATGREQGLGYRWQSRLLRGREETCLWKALLVREAYSE